MSRESEAKAELIRRFIADLRAHSSPLYLIDRWNETLAEGGLGYERNKMHKKDVIKPETVKLETVPVGNCFEFQGHEYMRMENAFAAIRWPGEPDMINAVHMERATLELFHKDNDVLAFEADRKTHV